MQTTMTLKDDFKIPDVVLRTYPLYLSVTHQLEDHQLIAPMQNVFATTVHSNTQSECYCDVNVAYAVGVIFKIVLDQDTKLLDQLLQLATKQKDEKLIWAFQLIQFTVYQLYKQDTQLYLSIILNNKTIPKPQLTQEQVPLTASSIYSLVLVTDMSKFFQDIQLSNHIPFQCINDSNFNPEMEITLYQVTKAFPAIVLIKFTEAQLQQHVWNKHVAFVKDVLVQLLMDVLSDQKNRSTLINVLKIQPYIVNSYEEFCKLLLLQDEVKIKQMLSNKQFQKYFEDNLKSKDATANSQKIGQVLTEQLIDSDKKQNQNQNVQNQKAETKVEDFDPFKTQAPKSAVENGKKVARFTTMTTR